MDDLTKCNTDYLLELAYVFKEQGKKQFYEREVKELNRRDITVTNELLLKYKINL